MRPNATYLTSQISLSSPLENGPDHYLEKTRIPFTKTCFGQHLVEIGLMVLEEKNFKFH